MRLMLSGFHHWSPVSCMQVACNAMQFSRVSLFYTFSDIFSVQLTFLQQFKLLLFSLLLLCENSLPCDKCQGTMDGQQQGGGGGGTGRG